MHFSRRSFILSVARVALFATLLLGAILQCAAPFVANLRTVRENENVIVYALSADKFPAEESLRSQLPPVRKLPALSVAQVRALLGNIEYRKETIWGVVHGRVYHPKELDLVAAVVSEALPRLGERDRLVAISRFDQDASVLSRLERVSMLLWADEKSIHLVFGEIRYEIPHNDYYEIQDWTTILPISLRQSFPYLSLVSSDTFQLKQISGFTHETWAVFDAKTAAGLAYIPPDRGKQSERSRRDYSDRRRVLRKMKDAGLVTPAEFEVRQAAIARDESMQLLRDALESGVLSREDFEAKTRELQYGPGKRERPPAKKEGPDPKDVPDLKPDAKTEPRSQEPRKEAPKEDEPKKDESKKDESGKGESKQAPEPDPAKKGEP